MQKRLLKMVQVEEVPAKKNAQNEKSNINKTT